MRVELEAPVVLHESADALWHIPSLHRGRVRLQIGAEGEGTPHDVWPTLCGLEGFVYVFAEIVRRHRRCCSVCVRRNAGADLVVPANGELPARDARRARRARPVSAQLTRERLLVLHHCYANDGVGMSRLGELYFERLGFASMTSCANAIARGFAELGLPTRTRGESSRLRAEAMRRQGFGGRGYERRLGVETVRRLRVLYEAGHSSHVIASRFYARLGYETAERLRSAVEYAWKQQGLKLRSAREATLLARARGHNRCAATTTGSDGRRPRPCPQAPLAGEEYCLHHHPDHAEEVIDRAAALRARKRVYEKVPWALVRPHLTPLLVPRPDRFNRLLETASGALARHTGVNPAITARLLKHEPDEITVQRANQLLAPLGLDVLAITTTTELSCAA